MEENKKNNSVGTYWMSIDRNKCFDDEITVLTVEVPKQFHNLPEVVKAKAKELENLNKYGTFDEVKDEGQDKITGRWVIMKEMKLT